jgi:hypothetical protein
LRSEATKTANEELNGRTRGTTDNKGVAPTRDSYGKTKVQEDYHGLRQLKYEF